MVFNLWLIWQTQRSRFTLICSPCCFQQLLGSWTDYEIKKGKMMTFWHDRLWLQVLLIVWTLRRLLSGFHGFICEKQWHHLRKQFLTDMGGLSFFFFLFQLWLRTSNDSLVYLKKKTIPLSFNLHTRVTCWYNELFHHPLSRSCE